MLIGLIPARGGSKGIKRKNIKEIFGKPLIAWTIRQAIESKSLDRVIVSTDDDEIANISVDFGAEVPFIRPKKIALDQSPGIDNVLNLIEEIPETKKILYLQPTSPLREIEDIINIIDYQSKHDAESCISISESPKHPSWMYLCNNNKKVIPILDQEQTLRRQDLSKVYVINGALYLGNTEFYKREKKFINSETIGYIMPKERSIDIDDMDDWRLAELKLKMKFKQN